MKTIKTKEEKAAYQKEYYLKNIEIRKLQNNNYYLCNKKPKIVKTKEELAKISNESYHRNKEKLSELRKIKYLEKKGIVIKEKEIVVKRTLSIHEILDTLHKDKKNYLWNKSITQWNKTDWTKFNLI